MDARRSGDEGRISFPATASPAPGRGSGAGEYRGGRGQQSGERGLGGGDRGEGRDSKGKQFQIPCVDSFHLSPPLRGQAIIANPRRLGRGAVPSARGAAEDPVASGSRSACDPSRFQMRSFRCARWKLWRKGAGEHKGARDRCTAAHTQRWIFESQRRIRIPALDLKAPMLSLQRSARLRKSSAGFAEPSARTRCHFHGRGTVAKPCTYALPLSWKGHCHKILKP